MSQGGFHSLCLLRRLIVKSISCSSTLTAEILLKGCVQIRLMRCFAAEWKRERGRDNRDKRQCSSCHADQERNLKKELQNWLKLCGKNIKLEDFGSFDSTAVSSRNRLPCLCWVPTAVSWCWCAPSVGWQSNSQVISTSVENKQINAAASPFLIVTL